jgi:ParB-like chromosome segregation protein Spo0J
MTPPKRASLKISFGGQHVGLPGNGGDGPAAVKMRPQRIIVDPKEVQEPDFEDRTESLKEGLEDLAGMMKDHAELSAENVGNFAPIVVVGIAPPYTLIAGRRRLLAARMHGLRLAAERYSSMPEEYQLLLRYAENAGRNSYTDNELIANVTKERANGKTVEWLSKAFVRSVSTVEKYLRVGQDEVLRGEMKRGLSLRRALDLVKQHGDAAGQAAKESRETAGADRHEPIRSGRKGEGDQAAGGAKDKPPVTMSFVDGKVFAVKADLARLTDVKDKEALHKFLSDYRKKLGAEIQAENRRGQA